jgi:hypothetical protein
MAFRVKVEPVWRRLSGPSRIKDPRVDGVFIKLASRHGHAQYGSPEIQHVVTMRSLTTRTNSSR